MYYITFINNETKQKEKMVFSNFKGAFCQYIEILNKPWWEADISELKIFKNSRELTKEINKFLSKNWRG